LLHRKKEYTIAYLNTVLVRIIY